MPRRLHTATALAKTGGRTRRGTALVKRAMVLDVRVHEFLPPQQWLRQA